MYWKKAVESTLKRQNMHFYGTFSENKAAVVERFNRTLKSRMWRYFTHNNTYRYIDALHELVSVYNASPHKGVGMAPVEVNDSNQLKIWNKYYSQGVNCKPFKFAIKDHVRISRDKVCLRKDTFRVGRKNILS